LNDNHNIVLMFCAFTAGRPCSRITAASPPLAPPESSVCSRMRPCWHPYRHFWSLQLGRGLPNRSL